MVSGATSQVKKTKWLKFDTIDTLPSDHVCCLYRKKGSIYQHTGIYLGNGYVIDARGSNSGVIKSKLSSYAWTHWGIPVGLLTNTELNSTTTTIPKIEEMIQVMYQATVIADSGSNVRMRNSASATADTIMKIELGKTVEVLSETGNGWSQIEYNNQTGYMMSKFLKKVESEAGAYYVRIKCPSKEVAEQLADCLRQATVG